MRASEPGSRLPPERSCCVVAAVAAHRLGCRILKRTRPGCRPTHISAGGDGLGVADHARAPVYSLRRRFRRSSRDGEEWYRKASPGPGK